MKQLLGHVILVWAAFIHGKVIYQAGKFPYSKCKQTSNDVSCETLSTKKESLWPPGPYALVMSTFGCPESHLQGWRKGILKLETSAMGEDLEFHFCVKVRHDLEQDKGRWIPGNYTIFKKGETCPEEFLEFKQTLDNETFSGNFSYFGHVPNFTANNDYVGINLEERGGSVEFKCLAQGHTHSWWRRGPILKQTYHNYMKLTIIVTQKIWTFITCAVLSD